MPAITEADEQQPSKIKRKLRAEARSFPSHHPGREGQATGITRRGASSFSEED
jgi:hypothetical protein